VTSASLEEETNQMTPDTHTRLVTDLKDALAQSHGCPAGDCALLGDMSDVEFAGLSAFRGRLHAR
jgi:hypothetical protein